MSKIVMPSKHQGQMFGYDNTHDKLVPISCDENGILDSNVTVTAVTAVDHIYQKIQDGDFFTVARVFTSVPSGSFASVRMVGNSKDVHFSIITTTEGKGYLKTYSGTTYSNNGTLYVPFNRNSNSTNQAHCTVYLNQVVNVLGTLRGDDLLGASGAGIKAGGTFGDSVESILGSGKDVLIRVQNMDNSSRDIGIIINFYEV